MVVKKEEFLKKAEPFIRKLTEYAESLDSMQRDLVNLIGQIFSSGNVDDVMAALHLLRNQRIVVDKRILYLLYVFEYLNLNEIKFYGYDNVIYDISEKLKQFNHNSEEIVRRFLQMYARYEASGLNEDDIINYVFLDPLFTITKQEYNKNIQNRTSLLLKRIRETGLEHDKLWERLEMEKLIGVSGRNLGIVKRVLRDFFVKKKTFFIFGRKKFVKVANDDYKYRVHKVRELMTENRQLLGELLNSVSMLK